MANYYVYHAAAGSGTGADWTNAYTKLITAMAARLAGDIFYVADDHAETQATAMAIVSPGTETSPCFVYCVRRTGGSVPPVAADLRTTATISTTTASSISLQGMVRECNGIIFSAGSSTSAANVNVGSTLLTWRLVNCALRLGATNAANRINLGVQGAYTVLENCTVQFASVSHGIAVGGRVSIRGPATTSFITGATIPTNLFIPGTLVGHLVAEGVDFSAVPSGKFIYQSTGTVTHYAVLKDCKLGTGAIIASSTIPGTGAIEIVAIRCDAGDVNYDSFKKNRSGTQNTESLVVRSGGATDGATPISYEIVNSNSQSAPFEALPISFWNETTGSAVTVTLHAVNGTTSPTIRTNKEIWIEVEYLGTSGFPIGSRVSSGVASTLNTATTYSASTETWGGTSGERDNASRFYMSATFTPQEKGPVTIYVMASPFTAGGVVFVDPKPVIT